MLKENFRQGGGLVTVPASWLSDVAKILNNLQVRNGELIKAGTKWTIQCGPLLSISYHVTEGAPNGTQPTVNVADGWACYSRNAPVQIAAAQHTVTATGSVYVTLEFATGAFSATQFAATASVPASDDDTQVYIIADIVLSGSGGIASITQRHCGDIIETRA